MGTIVTPGLRKGSVTPPASKSHLHRLLIADFLAGDRSRLGDDPADSQDIIATKRCLKALDTDASAEAAKAGDLACERYVLSIGKLQIEVLDNLDKVAPAGALLFAAWPRIEGATGLPARVLAITPKQ